MDDDDPFDPKEWESRIDAFIRQQQQGTTPETPGERTVRLAREARRARAAQRAFLETLPDFESGRNLPVN